jgi:ketosteroid isomerase-like protein
MAVVPRDTWRAMSQENLQVVLEAHNAVNREDPDAFIACLSADVEWEDQPRGSFDPFPGLRGTYHGHAEVRKWFVEAFLDLWESFRVDVEEIIETSDGRVLNAFLLTARGKASGVETEVRGWQLLWLAEGKITRRQLFGDRNEAFEAAGLSE